MKISVACCTYNGAPFLDAQLRSVTAQSRRPDEIVIVDDGSTDATVEIATRFAHEAADTVAVRVERNASNQGVTANFEKAIALTTGDVVFLCDQDDVWQESKVETMVDVFERRPELLLLHSDARLIGSDGRPIGHSLFAALEFGADERRLVRTGSAFLALLTRNLATGATVALRRSLFVAARPFPPSWVHDEWLATIAASIGTVDYLDAPLIDYRQHAGNQIGMRKLSWLDKFRRLAVPRGTRYAKVEHRIGVLLERLVAMGAVVPADHLRSTRDKLAHAHVRASLPRARLARLRPVAREAVSGRYRRYSVGLQGMVRDCIEPM